jgi:hypothetical protein
LIARGKFDGSKCFNGVKKQSSWEDTTFGSIARHSDWHQVLSFFSIFVRKHPQEHGFLSKMIGGINPDEISSGSKGHCEDSSGAPVSDCETRKYLLRLRNNHTREESSLCRLSAAHCSGRNFSRTPSSRAQLVLPQSAQASFPLLVSPRLFVPSHADSCLQSDEGR